jgi:hypothetical protein
MPFETTPLNILLLGVVVLLGWGLRLLIFLASWALADLPDQAASKSLAAVTPVWIFAVVIGLVIDLLVRRLDPNLEVGFGLWRILAAVGAVALSACVAGPLYVAFLATGPRKGAFVAVAEALLTLFAAALLTAIVMVCLAVAQVMKRADAAPPAPVAPTALVRSWSPPLP